MIQNEIDKKDADKSYKKLIVNLTLERLPRVIRAVVHPMKTIFKEDRGRKRSKKGTAAYFTTTEKGGHILFYEDVHSGFSHAVHDMAHEYWHAFEWASGFKHRAKAKYDEVVDNLNMGNFSKDAIEDFGLIAEVAAQFTQDPEFHENLRNFKNLWIRGEADYFKHHQAYIDFMGQVEATVDNREFYESLGEVLAESLANIVTFESQKSISQSFEHWMHRKFSSKKEGT